MNLRVNYKLKMGQRRSEQQSPFRRNERWLCEEAVPEEPGLASASSWSTRPEPDPVAGTCRAHAELQLGLPPWYRRGTGQVIRVRMLQGRAPSRARGKG